MDIILTVQQTSEGTYQFNVNSFVVDTTAHDDINGESVLEGNELNINTAAARKPRPTSILRKRIKKVLKASEMPAGAVSKMMTSKQLNLMDVDMQELWQT